MQLTEMTKLPGFRLLLLGFALAASTTSPMTAQESSCTDTASCFQSAQNKIVEVDGISGNSSQGYGFWDQTDGALFKPWAGWPQSGNLPGGTIPYSFPFASGGSYPSSQPFDVTPIITFYNPNKQKSPFTFSNGFTVAMMVWNSTQITALPASYWNWIDNNKISHLSAVRNGARWGLEVWSQMSGQYIVEYPWDLVSPGPAWNYVFYTFTPDGKCRIDLFVGSTYRSALLDLGRPDLIYTLGAPTSNPPQPPTFSPWEIYSYALGNGPLNTPGTGFVAVSFFQPLTQQEASSFYKMSYSGTYIDAGNGIPCDTGLALNVTAPGGGAPMPITPCGNVSNWNYTTPPASPRLSLSSNSLTFTTTGQAQIAVTNTGSSTLTITGISLAGDDPNDFSESDNCSGSSIAPGADCIVSVAADQLPTGDSGAALVVTSNAVIPGIVQLVEAPPPTPAPIASN